MTALQTSISSLRFGFLLCELELNILSFPLPRSEPLVHSASFLLRRPNYQEVSGLLEMLVKPTRVSWCVHQYYLPCHRFRPTTSSMKLTSLSHFPDQLHFGRLRGIGDAYGGVFGEGPCERWKDFRCANGLPSLLTRGKPELSFRSRRPGETCINYFHTFYEKFVKDRVASVR